MEAQELMDQILEIHFDGVRLYKKVNDFLSQPELINIPHSALADVLRLSSVLYQFSGHSGFYSKIEQSGDACRLPAQSPDVLGQGGNL